MNQKIARRLRIKKHIRTVVNGTAERPRLTVFRSNAQIYAQVIDDKAGKTLASASSLKLGKLSHADQATQVGQLIAKAALEAGVKAVVFDRNGYLYHGRVKQLADAAREAGLNF